jgi:hypothetical protein
MGRALFPAFFMAAGVNFIEKFYIHFIYKGIMRRYIMTVH